MEFKKEVIDWNKLVNIIYEKTGKVYKKNYLMNVRNGYTGNKTIEKIYAEIGINQNGTT